MDNAKMRNNGRHRLILAAFDLAVLLLVDIFILGFYPSENKPLAQGIILLHTALSIACIFGWRIVGGVYREVWRYGSSASYLKLILLDLAAGATYYAIQKATLSRYQSITFIRIVSVITLNVLADVAMRYVYQFLYDYRGSSRLVRTLRKLSRPVTGFTEETQGMEGYSGHQDRRIRIAIVGAGRVGVSLADELFSNPMAAYRPVCFVDTDSEKIGRNIKGIPVLPEHAVSRENFADYKVQEIVFALPRMDNERKRALYQEYKKTGCKIKVYDFPVTQSMEKGRRHLREFDIEDLLFRKTRDFADERTAAYYRGKAVLITGGGGSIGSELARQIAKMKPSKLIILDVYENGAYDLQQELRIAYGSALDLSVEIVSITDRAEVEKVFRRYHPDIVVHAAAHKHVPLMEDNCCEAIKNNVFGTLNVVETAERFGTRKFTMVSTDKAVNPTNVMGATKRMCEMIVLSRCDSLVTNFSATRFGNVLGSNGSVIPLFRRQIAHGGPITLTDKRIIRYFMTIPEASELVLTSSAMAKSGELYVLDMGKPVKILDLAESMIRLSGLEPYRDINIVEVGLRPGEKLYEELLIRSEELDKTDNTMIFIERDKPLSRAEIDKKLRILKNATETGDDLLCRKALMRAVPTFRDPREVNRDAEAADEMRAVED